MTTDQGERGSGVKEICMQLEVALSGISTCELPMLLGGLERMKGNILVRIVAAPQRPPEPDGAGDVGKFLTVKEVVERFHVTPKWLYRNKRKLPHSQPSRKVLLFPEQPLLRWFQKRC
jgi:hypothetical protein